MKCYWYMIKNEWSVFWMKMFLEILFWQACGSFSTTIIYAILKCNYTSFPRKHVFSQISGSGILLQIWSSLCHEYHYYLLWTIYICLLSFYMIFKCCFKMCFLYFVWIWCFVRNDEIKLWNQIKITYAEESTGYNYINFFWSKGHTFWRWDGWNIPEILMMRYWIASHSNIKA